MISLTRECSRLKRAAARGVPIYPNPSRPPLHTPSYNSFNAGKANDNNHQEIPDIGSSSSSYTESTTQNSSQSSGYFDDDEDRDEFHNEGGEGRDEGQKREEECRGEYNAQNRRNKDDEFVMRKNATEFDQLKQQQINVNSSKSVNQKGVQGTSRSKKNNANDVNGAERLRRNIRRNVNEEEKSVVGKRGGTVISNELSGFCSFCGKYIKRIESGSVVKNDTSVSDDFCGNHKAEVSEEEEEEEVMRGDDRHDCRSGGNGGTGGEEGRGSTTTDTANRRLDRNRGNNAACARPTSLNKNNNKSLTLNSHKDYNNDATLNTNNPETVTTNLSIFTDFASKLKDEEILEKVQTPSEFFAYMRNKKERDEREKVEKREADKRKEIEIKGNIRNNARCLFEMNIDREINGPTERGDDAFIKVDGKNRISTATGERHGRDREINDHSNSKGIQKTNNYNESDRNKVQVPSSSISLRMDADGTLDPSILEFQDSLVNISMDSCHEYNQDANNDNDENKKQDNTHENIKSIMQDKILTLHIDEDECHSDDSMGGLRQSASFQKSRLARIGTAECSPRLVYAVKDKEKEKEKKEKEKEKERNSSLPIAQGQGLVMGDFGSSESTVTTESALELRATNTGNKSFSFTTDKKSESDGVLAGTVGNDFSSHPYISLNSSPVIPPPTPSAAIVMTGTSASNLNVHVNKKVTQEVFALRSALGYQSTDGSPSSDSTAAKMRGKGKGIGQGERGASLTDSCSDSEGTANSNSTGSESHINYSRGLDLMQLANESSLDDYIGRSEKERRGEEKEREGERKREGQDNGERGKEGEESNKSASFKAPYRYLKSKTLRSREAEKNRSRSSSRSREYDENGGNSNSRTVCRSLSPPPPPSTHTAHPNDVLPLLHGIPQAPPSSSSLPSSVGPSQPTPPRAPIDSYFNDFISPSPPSGTARPVSPSLLHSNPLSPLYSPPFPNGLPKVSLPFNSSSVEEAEKEIRSRMDSRPYSGMSHVTLLY